MTINESNNSWLIQISIQKNWVRTLLFILNERLITQLNQPSQKCLNSIIGEPLHEDICEYGRQSFRATLERVCKHVHKQFFRFFIFFVVILVKEAFFKLELELERPSSHYRAIVDLFLSRVELHIIEF